MATTTNYGWTTPDDTALVKDGASAIRTLGTSVDTTTKNLNPQTTLGDLAYRSSTSNVNTRLPIGTSGQFLSVVAGVPAWAALTDQTPLTTKGDLFTFSTIDARLGVGANDTVLTADSAEATGLKWATPASGGMTSLATGTLSGTSVTLSSISASYVNLFLIITNPFLASGASSLTARINGVTSADYSGVCLKAPGTATDTYSSNSSLMFNQGEWNLPTSSSNQSFSLLIPNYATATFHNYHTYANGGTSTTKTMMHSHFANTSAAVSSIQIRTQDGTLSFSGGTYTLYGVK